MTPEYVVTAARRSIGEFDLDPASTPEANKLVDAERIFTEKDDGLRRKWRGNVFLNPPGGAFALHEPRTIGDPGRWGYTRSRQALWWLKLMIEFEMNRTKRAIFVGFSIEILQSAQQLKCLQPVHFPMCVPRKRIPFDKWVNGARVTQPQPGHANVIVLVCDEDDTKVVNNFCRAFAPLGGVFNT